MVCRDTCVQYSNTEKDIVSNPQICTPDARLTRTENATRYATLNNDYVDCTDWTSLVSTNNQTCVEGIENEGNCGWGPGVSDQLCAYCDPSGNNTVSSCCYDAKTDLSQCADYGFPLAARISPTMSVPAQIGSTSTGAPSSTGASSSDRSGNSSRGTRLTGGQLAGIIVGSIVGALLLGALLALLFLRLCRRNRDGESAGRQNLVYGAAARGSGNEKPWNQSDEGTARSLGGSPPMGSEKYATGAAGAGVGLGAAALAASGAAAGNRNTENRPISAMTGSSGTDGRGTTVSFVRDQYSGHDIRPGDQVVTVYPYHASLNDEISIEPDEVLVVLRLYDDGWALGKTATTEGAFPLVCVTSAKSTTPRPSTDAPTARAAPTDGGLTSEAEGAVTADEGFTTSNSEGNGSSTRR